MHVPLYLHKKTPRANDGRGVFLCSVGEDAYSTVTLASSTMTAY